MLWFRIALVLLVLSRNATNGGVFDGLFGTKPDEQQEVKNIEKIRNENYDEARAPENAKATKSNEAAIPVLLEKHVRVPGITFDQTTQELVGPPEVLPKKDYNSLYPDPVSLFAVGEIQNVSDADARNQLEQIRESVARKRAKLEWITREMDGIVGGDPTRIPNLMTLLNDASDSALKFVFVGSQSVGKSHVLNVVTQLSLSAMNISMGTKAPVHGRMGTVPKNEERFQVNGVSLRFEEILPELKKIFERQSSVTESEVGVLVYAPFIAFPMEFIDLPGYVITKPADSELVIRMIRKYASEPNVIFVMIADASRDPHTEADSVLRVLRETVEDSRIMFIINKVNLLMNEGHSEREFVSRIRHLVDYLGCSDDNLPYIFTVPKDKDLGEADERLPPEQQSARWAALVAKGDEIAKDLVLKYGKTFHTMFKHGYPLERIGVKAWKNHSTRRIMDSFRKTFDEFVMTEERQAPIAEDFVKLEIPVWSKVIDDFAFELVNKIERVSTGTDGIWEIILELGGEEFVESDETRVPRTAACVEKIIASDSKVRRPHFLSNVTGRTIVNPIEYISRKSERGNALLLREIFEQRDWMQRAFFYPTDEQIETLIGKERRTTTVCDHNIVPLVLSHIANRIFSETVVHRQVLKLQCSLRRIARAAMWVLLEERNETDPIHILVRQAKFQAFANEKFDEYMKGIYERSVKWMTKATGHCMDGPIYDRLQLAKKPLLQITFKDLQENWPHIPQEYQCLPLVARRSEHERYSMRDFYATLRNQALVQYSDRIMLLMEMVSAHHTMEWEQLTRHESLKGLRELLRSSYSEEVLAQKFELGKGFISATELQMEKDKLMRGLRQHVQEIRKRMPSVVNVMKEFDPYQPRFASETEKSATKTKLPLNAEKAEETGRSEGQNTTKQPSSGKAAASD